MARMFKALCLRDCAQDAIEGVRPFARYREGKEYFIPEDSPLLVHFRPLEELPAKDQEVVAPSQVPIAPDGKQASQP
jgi:hypothetical protein